MIAELVVITVILTTMGYIYLKGSLVKSFVLFMCSLIAAVVALSFFETAGRMVIGYGYGGQWVFTGVLILIFAITFIVLMIIAEKIEPFELFFGDLPDRIGKCLLAIPTGLIIVGILLIAVNLSPLSEKWPYERYKMDSTTGSPDQPDKALILNADGFTAGLASTISKGSMSDKKSLAVFHPMLLDELALNRSIEDESNPIIAGTDAIAVKSACWASDILAEKIKKEPGKKPIIVQAEIRNSLVKEGGALFSVESGMVTFTFAQVRLICTDAPDSYKGTGELEFPIGWLNPDGSIVTKALKEEIKLSGQDFPDGTKTIDFIFNVPTGKTPAMLQFKINAVAEITRVKKADETEAAEQTK
ncbi:MAG: hypothetical protein LLF92_11105 [Planctomycetaceae bacterium]|nr:hypothetical protein [Planctomycetaceae bacterium]